MSDYVIADISDDPRAAERVAVPKSFRARVLGRGLAHAGYVAYKNLVVGYASLVEVLETKKQGTVGVVFNGGRFGDGLALRTILDDGTIIASEAYERGPRWRLLRSRWRPMHHPSERFFVFGYRVAPERLFDLHDANVRRISRRRGAQPVAAEDALRLYVATRIRSAQLHVARAHRLFRARAYAFWVLFGGLLVAVEALAFAVRGASMMLRLMPVAVCAAALAAFLLAGRVSLMLEKKRAASGATPSSRDLLESAGRVRRCRIDAL